MDFSSCLMMNIMSAHNIISNEEVPPTFAGYGNDSIGNAQVVCQGGELNFFVYNTMFLPSCCFKTMLNKLVFQRNNQQLDKASVDNEQRMRDLINKGK